MAKENERPETARRHDEPVELPAVAEGMMDMVAAATAELKGIRAVCTALAIENLWNWDRREHLLKARAAIDYLLGLDNGKEERNGKV